jgi:hypothetical protein
MNIQRIPLLLILLFVSLTPGILHACELSQTEKARLFSKFDKNGNGTLSRDEYVYSEMRRLGKTGPEIMKQMDKRYREIAPTGEITPLMFKPVNLTRCQP